MSKPTRSNSSASTKTPQLIISESLESLKKIIELDTDSTLVDLNLLEKLNNEATSRYRSIRGSMTELESTARHAEETQEVIENIGQGIGQLEAKVDKLLAVVSEIDEWSKELEVKTKRYTK